MLLAVEGGGFFSSSASGYRNGLTLLLLGRWSEERPMRVLPWNQYKLLAQNGDLDLQLASRKEQVFRGCTSFVCFSCASAGVDAPPPTKVDLVSQSATQDPCISDRGNQSTSATVEDRDRKVFLKSNLKKPLTRCSSISSEGDHAHYSPKVMESNVSNSIERRKVQWTDTCGKELVEIKEFEPSDDDSSDDEFEGEGNQKCECVIQ